MSLTTSFHLIATEREQAEFSFLTPQRQPKKKKKNRDAMYYDFLWNVKNLIYLLYVGFSYYLVFEAMVTHAFPCCVIN